VNFEVDTLTDLWEGAANTMFFGTAEDGIEKGSSMTRCYSHFVRCSSMAYEMDVWRDLHLTKNRFPVLQRTYLDPQEYDDFLVRCGRVASDRGAVTKLSAIAHKPRGINRTKKTGNYAHGGCILGWTFRVEKTTKQPVMGLWSRVSYVSYMGALDLALCYHMAKEIGAQLGVPVEDFAFDWHCECFQFAHMQSVSYVWNRPELMAAIKDEKQWSDAQYPTIKLMRKTIKEFVRKRREGFAPEDEKFAQLMRYRRRWEERVAKSGKWPDIPVDTLDLSALRRGGKVHSGEDGEDE
jgi:hypothetical protein